MLPASAGLKYLFTWPHGPEDRRMHVCYRPFRRLCFKTGAVTQFLLLKGHVLCGVADVCCSGSQMRQPAFLMKTRIQTDVFVLKFHSNCIILFCFCILWIDSISDAASQYRGFLQMFKHLHQTQVRAVDGYQYFGRISRVLLLGVAAVGSTEILVTTMSQPR